MPTVTLDLPPPPSVNKYWRHVGPRVLVSRKGHKYRRDVGLAVILAGCPRLEGRITASAVYHPPDRRRRDLDNIQKALFDALQKAGVYADDSQIDALAVTRGDVLPGGLVRVTLTSDGNSIA